MTVSFSVPSRYRSEEGKEGISLIKRNASE